VQSAVPTRESSWGLPSAATMNRKRTLRMKVRVVAPGTLKSNSHNPFAKENAEERREGMLRTLTCGLAQIIRKNSPERVSIQERRIPQPA